MIARPATLDALRELGGSGTPGEVVEQVARDMGISESTQSELTESGAPRFPNQVAWARFERLELGLKPVAAFEIDESFFDEFRSSKSDS